MSPASKNFISYQGLERQRILLAALVLGLAVVVVGVLFEVYYQGARSSKISPATRLLAEPLNPVLNTEVLSQLDAYEQLSLEQIRGQFALEPPAQRLQNLAQEAEAASGEPDLVQQSIDTNTLSEEETLSDEELESLLNSTENEVATQEATL